MSSTCTRWHGGEGKRDNRRTSPRQPWFGGIRRTAKTCRRRMAEDLARRVPSRADASERHERLAVRAVAAGGSAVERPRPSVWRVLWRGHGGIGALGPDLLRAGSEDCKCALGPDRDVLGGRVHAPGVLTGGRLLHSESGGVRIRCNEDVR